jgi:catechol 2,3-dioxygenase
MTQASRTITESVGDAARNDADPILETGVAPLGWRLPAATSLGHVSLQVGDLVRSLAYYESVLGLRAIERSDGAALLGTADGNTPLVELKERKGASQVPMHGRLGLYHFAILMPNRPALGRFIAHLAKGAHRFGASDHLVSEALYLRDPDGLGIEVYADRPRESWRAVDGQLKMASEPLDLDDVVRSANGEPWTGMPRGTTMGHLHLHVANLDEAAAFYHAALGFDKMVWTYQGALFLGAGGYHHHLGVNTWAGPGAPRPTDADARLLEWRIVLPTSADGQQCADSLTADGHAVTVGEDSWVVSDPWGTRVRLMHR